jgi:hypothetical protein
MSNNKQQTAVEWFAQQLYERFTMKGDGKLYQLLFEQANAMHKEEIKIAYYNGTTDEIKTKDELLLDAEHYYNETYGDESNP